jgi:hypothetical protein
MKSSRGERNRNPGNLDRVPGQHWLGMSQDQSGDPRFVVFDEPKWGIRALAKTLLTYYRKHGRNTARKIINRWAPSTENDTSAYVLHVAKLLQLGPDEVFAVDSAPMLQILTKAIIQHENGRVIYPDEEIAKAVEMALL